MESRLSFLEEREIETIHEMSLAILAKTGVRIRSGKARQLLYEAGATIQGEQVMFPPTLVEGSLQTVKQDMYLYGRGTANPLHPYNLTTPLITTNYPTPFVLDYRDGQQRYGTTNDLKELAIIVDYYKEIPLFGVGITPGDIVPAMEELHAFAIALRHTAKHIQHVVSSPEMARWQIRLAGLLAGGEENLQKKPIFSCQISPLSPLVLGAREADTVLLLARHGIPIVTMNYALAGTTAPASPLGALALANAENLAILTLIKCVNPAGHMIYGADNSVADRHTGVVDYTAPEYLLFAAANSQMAAYYGLPSAVSHNASEEIAHDRTTWDRNVMILALSLMTRTDLSIWLGSYNDAWATSLVHLVISLEQYEDAKAYMAAKSQLGDIGELIAKYRNLFYRHDDENPILHDGKRRIFHRDMSREDQIAVAKEQIQWILKHHAPPFLAPEISREMDMMLQAAQCELVKNGKQAARR